ncbi:hypothetical protein PP175_28765 (plasmid) [Aneurinibacillus sp. Ricciae_BoGa-3]|uniref:hypothetical protein n=1 Tax=Aneurinibacillus sp. Ricciae_BoGa-3 TaxID=3022697 RepID=UPI002340E14D|nr:hypothetical protein [Aneurinibacillus sp. Ricciae_BoGa-3]WCK57183.1 hypothetical protein PP175_28765 [Aneurinibacillus sp. Ricciae_BoGa-3]
MLLEGKGWIAQEFYNEYLRLKEEIFNLTKYVQYEKNAELEAKLEEKVKRLRFVLQQLKLNGVALEDLILLSIGVEV